MVAVEIVQTLEEADFFKGLDPHQILEGMISGCNVHHARPQARHRPGEVREVRGVRGGLPAEVQRRAPVEKQASGCLIKSYNSLKK
jgi:hypothetical protein